MSRAMAACGVCGARFPDDQIEVIGGKSVCAGCKPDFLMNLKGGAGAGGKIDPDKAREIKSRIKQLNLLSFAFAIPGFALQFAGGPPTGHDGRPTPLAGLGGLLVIVGLCIYARMKNRSWTWGLFGLLSIVGLIVLYFLGPVCSQCGQKEGHSEKTCRSCGAPVA